MRCGRNASSGNSASVRRRERARRRHIRLPKNSAPRRRKKLPRLSCRLPTHPARWSAGLTAQPLADSIAWLGIYGARPPWFRLLLRPAVEAEPAEARAAEAVREAVTKVRASSAGLPARW